MYQGLDAVGPDQQVRVSINSVMDLGKIIGVSINSVMDLGKIIEVKIFLSIF